MRDKELKYPIGTKVIYNPPYPLYLSDERYRNKIGTIVGVGRRIFPQCRFSDGIQISTAWESLEEAKVKGEQLVFEFYK